MWARWEVGDQVGPYTVESVVLTPLDEGEWQETMVNSGGGSQRLTHHLPQPPRSYNLTPTEEETRVIIPYVPNFAREGNDYSERNPDTVAGAPENAEWVNVQGSPWNYWSLLKAAWTPEHNLFLIEHDVQCRPDIVAGYEECSEVWCVTNYHHFSEESAAAWHWSILGCTRFRKELIAKTPTLFSEMQERWRHWTEMSTGIGMELRKLGYAPHEHFPRVVHHQMRGVGINRVTGDSVGD